MEELYLNRGKTKSQYIQICNIQGWVLIPGTNFPIYGVSDPEAPLPNTIIFVKNSLSNQDGIRNSIIVTKDRLDLDDSCVQIVDKNHKKAYAEVLLKLEKELPVYEEKAVNGSYISSGAIIGSNTKIGKFCVIEGDVVIGDDCEIADYVYIGAHTRIGNHVNIMSKCVIGNADADIYRDGDCCLTLPHLGGTIIEDGCLLLQGAHIAAGDTCATVMKSGAMLGICANVGHNSYIGKNTTIGAHACICGHCDIGNDVYIAPSTVVMNRLHIGDKAKTGLGSVVLQDVEPDTSVFGNPAMSYWKKK